eukprot:1983569-Rhodomonas_salina.1
MVLSSGPRHLSLAMSGTLMLLNIVNPTRAFSGAFHPRTFINDASALKLSPSSHLKPRSSLLQITCLSGTSPFSSRNSLQLGRRIQHFSSSGRDAKNPLLSALQDFAEEEAAKKGGAQQEDVPEKAAAGAATEGAVAQKEFELDDELREQLEMSDVDLVAMRLRVL